MAYNRPWFAWCLVLTGEIDMQELTGAVEELLHSEAQNRYVHGVQLHALSLHLGFCSGFR
jgi:hypothetical protein